MTPGEFIDKWRASELKERSASQSHFIDLCRLLGEPTPTDADPTGEWYCSYEGPSVKRRARYDLQHHQVSTGGAVRRLVLPGWNALAPVAPWGTHPTLIRAVAGVCRRSVPQSRLLCGHHVPEAGPIFEAGVLQPSNTPVTRHPAQRRPRPAGPGTRGFGLRRRRRQLARDRCWHTARGQPGACGPPPRS